jgi:hypothetical protein
MSSRVNVGKKSVKHMSAITKKYLTQASKAESAPASPQVQTVKVEFNPPPPQVIKLSQQRDSEEKDSPINWDVLGLLSAAVTLLGAAIFFMVGWSYEANWYGYYGISMSQVNLPAQQILVQSFPPTIIVLVVFGLFVSIYLTFVYFRERILEDMTQVQLTREWKNILQLFFSLIILVVGLGYIFVIITSNRCITSNCVNSEINTEANPLRILPFEFLSFVAAVYIFILSWVPESYFKKWERGLELEHERRQGYRERSRKPQVNYLSWFRVSIFILPILTISTSLSMLLGIYDASRGIRTYGNWNVQKIYISSSQPIEGIVSNPTIGCKKDQNCIYGPYILIAENDNEYYLTSWSKNSIYPRSPGLFILPKDYKDIVLINNIFIPSPTPSPIETIESTPTSPSPIVTSTLTLTPQPIISKTPTITRP